RMLLHAELAVGPDDGESGAEVARDAVLVRKVHRPRMEVRDLVVVEVGGDEPLRGELARDALQMRAAQPKRLESRKIGIDVLADGCHDDRILAQEPQVVGYVARGAAVLAPHLRREEAYVE